METNSRHETRNNILAAAKKVFIKKGHSGARMQEIADEAGINKALLHYYFSNKDTLFEYILFDSLKAILAQIQPVLDSDMDIYDMIRAFSSTYISFLQENSYIPGFILHEINQDPGKLVDFFSRAGIKPPVSMFRQFARAAGKSKAGPYDPYQLVLNILALCVFPFVARPVIQGIFQLDDKVFDDMIEERKHEVPEWIINSLKNG